MHSVAEKNKYVGMMFLKLTPAYFALGKEGIRKITNAHVGSLTKYAPQLKHIVCSGTTSRYDQITIMEADTLEEIYDATMDFKMGEKAAYIELVEMTVGILAPPRKDARKSKVAA